MEQKLSDEDKATIDMDAWVKDTENLTLSHLKELIISVFVMKKDYKETLDILRTMMQAGAQ